MLTDNDKFMIIIKLYDKNRNYINILDKMVFLCKNLEQKIKLEVNYINEQIRVNHRKSDTESENCLCHQ